MTEKHVGAKKSWEIKSYFFLSQADLFSLLRSIQSNPEGQKSSRKKRMSRKSVRNSNFLDFERSFLMWSISILRLRKKRPLTSVTLVKIVEFFSLYSVVRSISWNAWAFRGSIKVPSLIKQSKHRMNFYARYVNELDLSWLVPFLKY